MQEFEKHEKLKQHILRMASTGSVGSPSYWDDFVSDLNEALSSIERAVLAKAGEQEPVAVVAANKIDKLKAGENVKVHGCAPHMLYHPDYFVSLYAHPLPAQAIPEGWNLVTNENWNIPRIGQRVILCINGVVQNDSFVLDQADGEPGCGYYFWDRDDIDECPELKAGDMWIPWPSNAPSASPKP